MSFLESKSKWKSNTLAGLLFSAIAGFVHTAMMLIGGHNPSLFYEILMYVVLGLGLGGLIFAAFGRFVADASIR